VTEIFDRKLLKRNQQRYASEFANHNFLHVEIANRILENVASLNREFHHLLDISGKDGYLGSRIAANNKTLINFDLDSSLADLKEESFDLITSNLNFHFINDIPEFLLQIRNLLKPNGIFIASFFGEENLRELADILHISQNKINGGVSPIMPPTIDVKTAANLLQKSGFANPISDFEKIEVNYSNILNLFKDLKYMGQGNILHARSKRFFTKKLLSEIVKNYHEKYANEENQALATFEIVTITGWK